MINILLIDDHKILLDGVVELVSKYDDFSVYRTASGASEALNILADHYKDIQVVITDINLPDMSGIDLAGKIKEYNCNIKVIALSMHREKHVITDAIKQGVDGYVLKDSTHADLITAINTALCGESYVSSAVTKLLMDNIRNPSPVDALSDREKEIITLITQEYTTRKIAESLFISEKTVEAHKTNIFRKTQTSTLVGLTKFAFKYNLL